MRSWQIAGLLRTILVLALLSLAAYGQELGTAVLNGDVTDPQGAVVKGAQVIAQRSATGVQRATATGNAGLFSFNDLAPGDYTVTVKAAGFADATAPVRLVVGQQANLKVKLTVNVQKTVITIDDSEAVQQVNTVSSVVDGVVDAPQIDNLPVNGRNFLELSLLMPGNAPAPNFDPTKVNTFVVSSAGQLGRGGNVSINGTDDNDDAVGGMLINVPQDSVEEFQIATNRFSAEVGRSGSSVVNVVTKSGTNSVHGSASVYERDKVLQALPATFDPASASGETPPFRRQQYAGTLGGPLIKNKAWLYGAFEYRDQLGGVLGSTRHVGADPSQDFISNNFVSAPLNDLLGTTRGDWQPTDNNHFSFYYTLERQSSTGASIVGTALASPSQRQDLQNNFQDFRTTWTHVISPALLNRASFAINKFYNSTFPVTPGPQLDFPTVTDGASYRMPQKTWQQRLQWDEALDWVHGKHNIRVGGQFQRLGDEFYLGVFQAGRIEFVEDFPDFDRNGDGAVDDEDLLFAVTIRSGIPSQALVLPNCDNNHIAGYVQDDWHALPQLTLNLGLRYELDTDLNDLGHYDQINPILQPFLQGSRGKDTNNFGPRVGFNWANKAGEFSVHGGYGIYYDRITLEVESLERGLDGRALPIDVRVGNLAFLNPDGTFQPGAPTFSNAFTGPIIPGAGAAEGIDVIDNKMQNPSVQQFDLGIQWEPVHNWVVKADGIHNLGTHFIIGVPAGGVFNPDVGGPEGVTQLRSAVNTHYDALWLSLDRRFAGRYQFHAAYTLSKSLNYANDDQIPFAYPPIDPNNLHLEYGPTPNDGRHRIVLQGVVDLPFGLRFSPLWTIASAVPMDIMLPDNSSRVPVFNRNAGGREFRTPAQLNAAIDQINAGGGINGSLLPNVLNSAHFGDDFNSFDMRLSKDFRLREGMTLQVLGEAFNLFNVTNILGFSTTNYSGYRNALVRDSNDPTQPGYLLSSSFGTPASTAGGVFGSGGARAFQLGAKLTF